MKTIETIVHQIDKLTPEAQQKAIEKLCSINVDFEWWDSTYEDAFEWWDSTYEDAKTMGLLITSFDLDRNRHAKGSFLLAANEVAQNIFNNHGEDCETYKTATKFMEEWQPIFANYMDETSEHYESRESEDKLNDIEDDFLNNLLEDYSIMLQKECEYLQSGEAIIETIKANQVAISLRKEIN